MSAAFHDLVSIFAPAPAIRVPEFDFGDAYLNNAWTWMAMSIAAMRELDYDYTKGICYDILSRLMKDRERGARAAIDDVCDITRHGMRALQQRHLARLN